MTDVRVGGWGDGGGAQETARLEAVMSIQIRESVEASGYPAPGGTARLNTSDRCDQCGVRAYRLPGVLA
jgi:hypothetical protein